MPAMRRGQGAVAKGRRGPRDWRELSGLRSYALKRARRDGRIAIAASDKGRHRQAPDERSLPCRLSGWKCILLQWIVRSIFLKLKYPEKHNTINSLRAAILCKVGVFNSAASRRILGTLGFAMKQTVQPI